MSANINPTCPSGCTGVLPQLDFDYCDPVLGFGEITHIFLASIDSECFTNEENLSEWLARLSNTSADANAIRFLHVKADKPAPEREETEISLGRKVKSPGTFTLNIDVDDVSDLNHTFMRTSQCNITFRLWYVAGDYLFGGVCGVEANLNLDYVIERGTKSIHRITGTAKWDAQFSPERVSNPLAGTILGT